MGATTDSGADFGTCLRLNKMTMHTGERGARSGKITKTEDEGAASKGVFVDEFLPNSLEVEPHGGRDIF